MGSFAQGSDTQQTSTASGSTEGTGSGGPSAAKADDAAPKWARRLRASQAHRDHRQMTLQLLREGDRGGGGASPDIHEKED